MEESDIYLGVELYNMDNGHGDELWDMSQDKYCAAMVTNDDVTLDKKGLDLPPSVSHH